MRAARVFLSVFGLFLAVACGEETIGVQAAAIRVDPPAIDLSLDLYGTIERHTIEIESIGSAVLELRAVTLLGAEDGDPPPPDLALSLSEVLPQRIAPNSSFEFELQHLPRDALLDAGRLLIASDDPAQPLVTVPITQRAVGAPRVAAVPDPEAAEIEAATPSGVRTFIAAVRFGTVQPGLRKVETVHLVNIGGGGLPLELSAIEIVPAVPGLELRVEPSEASGEWLLPALGTPGLRPGLLRSIRAELAYAPPSASSTLSAVLRMESTDPANPSFEIPISGEGPGVDPATMRIVPAGPLDFGSVRVGQTADRMLTIHNDGASALQLDPLSITLNPGNVFSLLETPAAATIGVGQSRNFNLRFTPAAAATSQGNLRIDASSAGLSPVDVELHGTGTVEQSCTPAQIDPAEPTNDACAAAQDRGGIVLTGNQTESRSYGGQALERESDEDWSRYIIEVDGGCSLVGYQVTARATLPAGEQAEICVSLGACGSPERENCATGTASILLFIGTTLCDSFNNQVPFYVRVRRTGGTLSCEPYSVDVTAR